MPYHPLQLGDHVPGELRQFIANTHEPYLSQVHLLLSSALPGTDDAPGNQFQLSAAVMLLCVIAETASTLSLIEKRSGERFVLTMERFYPWDLDPPQGLVPVGAAHVLYKVFRNPLVHTSTAPPRRQRVVKIGSVFPNPKRIEEIETMIERPGQSSVVREGHKHVLWVDTLYWGVREMIRRTTADQQRCERILQRIKSGEVFR
jgi:hypothetical protein